MNFLTKLERKFGKFAIPNLMLYIMMGQAIVFFSNLLLPSLNLDAFLYFNPYLIAKGQIWRLISFVFIPSGTSAIFFIFAVFLYYSIGMSLERTWGTFKFNIYYLMGIIFNIIALLAVQLIFYNAADVRDVFYYVFGSSITFYLNLSLFLAYAALFPEVEFLLYGILPIKVKYLAFLDIALLAYEFIISPLPSRVLIIMSLLNFLIFFGGKFLNNRPTATQKQFRAAQKQRPEVKAGPPIKVAFHKCTVCGKTELTDPDMEFRYCSKCNGNYEYCMEHLHNHKHVE